MRYRARKLLTLRQDWGSSASTGASIWQGANIAAGYLENVVKNKISGSRVLELGGGVGFCGLVADALGAREVWITDGDPDVLKLTERNIDINVDSGNVHAAQLRWSTDDELPFISTAWDFIVAADVTYKRSSWHDLISCIYRLSTPGKTLTILAMEPRSRGTFSRIRYVGSNMNITDEVDGVLHEMKEVGLSWSEQRLPIDKEASMCGFTCGRLFLIQRPG